MFVPLLSLTTIALSCVVRGLPLKQLAKFGQYTGGTTGFASDNVCGDSTFNRETSSESPLVSDCQGMVDYLKSRDTGWVFYGWDKEHLDSGYAPAAFNATCTFGVKPIDANNGPAVMALGDAIDVIRDSITKFSSDGHVGASGVMGCQVSPGDADRLADGGGTEERKFKWQIYKSGSQPEVW
ncbi:hypothetical protein NUW58_g2246 [Xylaria curta]|uniref:Uncharacterized protein n=1 Tax=Xylaria curta TaxID=42375 RepID=A0ACC1PI89_9PEZI|nr:hypothetical protein NUW58_g2246 [Xylaria curta]